MALRAILRRRKYLLEHLNVHTRSIQSFSSFGHGWQSNDLQVSDWVAGHPSADAERGKERVQAIVDIDKFLGLKEIGFPKHNSWRVSILSQSHGNARSEIIFPLGIRCLSHSIRKVSTATAGQPEMGDQDNEEQNVKYKKEASPEECDQAVEGLTTVKAKAKAKQLQESQKDARSIIKKFWAKLLGIGPALRAVASMSREDWAKKFRHWKEEFISTLQHYWLGTKLFWADARISSRLLLKLASGKSLSRRERQQLTRTTADIFRLVPFAVFIIVPFMEFLLPVFLKLFPNMLPSTFQDKMKEQEALKRRLNARIEYAKFLQDTVKEMAKEVQVSHSGEIKKTAEDLDEFLNKVRTGARVSNEEILGFAKLFNDELTLDNISRPRLVNMCKYMGISPYGTDAYLRYMLQKRLQWIKNDDEMIQAEGVESLSEAELRQACRDRGQLGLLSVEEMRQQLRDWLDLSLNHSVPSSLLILSRAFTIVGKVRPEEAVQATLSSLPDEVVDTVGVTALPSEDSVSERRRKLEFLEMQEELIKEEEEKKKEEEEQARKKESGIDQEDLALKEMTIPTAREAQELAQEKMLEKQDQLCKLSCALAVLASASSVSREREQFLSLVNKEIELYNSMVDKEGTEGEEEAKKAYRAAREESDHAAEMAVGHKVSSALIDRVDAMLHKLEKEIDDVDAKIGDRWRLLDRYY
ncbi:uncharacterized protein LOC131240233 isoform X2 [Magnolia sinica]|uniref:uncharacterized protein LOC131240233 isoform X2 n=1 Tax=Magnolia sinica TaxID=86752 RepID=UPI0026594599|nr:uncharacterized protein LOC131240233 isoform X2 [Magnolia sinica]